MGRLFKLYLNSLIMHTLLKRRRENVWYIVNIYFNNVFFYSIGSEPINIHLKSDGHLQCEKLMQNRIFKSDLKRASPLLFFYTIVYILQYLCSTFDMVLQLFLFTFYGKQGVVINQQFTLISQRGSFVKGGKNRRRKDPSAYLEFKDFLKIKPTMLRHMPLSHNVETYASIPQS